MSVGRISTRVGSLEGESIDTEISVFQSKNMTNRLLWKDSYEEDRFGFVYGRLKSIKIVVLEKEAPKLLKIE